MPNDAHVKAVMLEGYRIPSITAYNRLEPNPRRPDFDQSLKAEVRDALWMLTRQWQFGEFQAEDAATAVTALILAQHTTMDRLSFPGEQVFTYDENIPLETQVERERLKPDLFLAVQMGRYFLKLMRLKSLQHLLTRFLSRYPLNFMIDPNDYEGRHLFQATRGRIFDGHKLYQDIVTIETSETESRFSKWLDGAENNDLAPAEKTNFREAATLYREWFQRTYSQPDRNSDSAWVPSQLEYQFAMGSAAQEQQRTLVADQYYEGRLDWFSFDVTSQKRLPLEPEPDSSRLPFENLVSFIPTPVEFKGMPNPRFWAMEDNQINFGKIETATTGLLHLLFAEFGLIYSNDWFLLPYPLSINTLCAVYGIVVTDVFGQHALIRPAGLGSESNWQRWTVFHHTDKDDSGLDTNLFYLPPALTKVLEADPLERVKFLRDEMANIVWAVEAIVPSQSGKGVNGNEMAASAHPQEEFVSARGSRIRYVVGTTVPENWIPFVPVHLEGGATEIRLQRARMPASKGPLGAILTEKAAPYFINEEEIPRSGVIVQRYFQRARWLNGRTYLWIGRFKDAGEGEGWSNLKFDQIQSV